MTDQPKRGFAALDPERRREIAQRGGRAAHLLGRGHEFSAEDARAAGKKGGRVTAARPGHMAAIGRKGGAVVAANALHMATIGRKGGSSRKP